MLEIGAFFGVVCMALADLGYEVTAADIPEYIDLPAQVERYARHHIQTKGVRLEDFVLPFEDESFDIVVMCEVLEHLNFNPVPLLKEINRVGKPGSVLYLSLPNGAQLANRRRLLRGKATGVGVDSFFEQLDPASSAIANGHWYEYGADDVRTMLERLGYSIARQYFFGASETIRGDSLRNKLARLFYRSFPALKENQTTIAIRERKTDLILRIPSTVHRTLREL